MRSSTVCFLLSAVWGQEEAAPVALAESGCVADQSIPLFLWTEWPGSYEPLGYYAQLLAFMQGNCIGARVDRVVLRVLHPEHPSPSESFWWPPSESSPFYAGFLSKVSPGVTLIAYPYVMEQLAGEAWMNLGGTGSPVDGVYEFISKWNEFLATSGNPSVRLSGAVFDLEENPGMRSYSGMEVNGKVGSAMREKYGGSLSFEVTTGFDVLGKMRDPGFDKVYGQFYDFYAPVIFAAKSSSESPFILHKDDAIGMSDYIIEQAVGQGLLNKYADVKDKLLVMWSNQNIGGECLFGDGSGQCGLNYEFGVWSAAGFHAFLREIRNRGVLGELSHGLFQFSFVPQDWTR